MDPVSSALNLAGLIVNLITQVWNATPKDQQATIAADVAKTLHNTSAFIQAIQEKVAPVVAK